MCLCYLFSAKTAWQLVNRKADFYKTNRFESIRITNRIESIRITNRIESIRIANWNALVSGAQSAWDNHFTAASFAKYSPGPANVCLHLVASENRHSYVDQVP